MIFVCESQSCSAPIRSSRKLYEQSVIAVKFGHSERSKLQSVDSDQCNNGGVVIFKVCPHQEEEEEQSEGVLESASQTKNFVSSDFRYHFWFGCHVT